MTQTEPAKQSQVSQEIVLFRTNLDEFDNVIDRLADRLTPVLRQEPANPNTEVNPKEQKLVPLACKLRELRVDYMNKRLRISDIIECLEI